MKSERDSDCASATASASDSVQRARADRLAKHKQRVQRDLEATQALAVEQRRKADQVIGDLPFLAAVCKDIGVQAPAAIELLRAGQKLGAGSYGQVIGATCRFAGPLRPVVRHVVLKKILSRDWWEAAGEIDDEVMQLTALHAQFDTARPRFKARCALPLRLPIPRVLGLYVEDEPTLLGIQTRVCGFYMERYHCSLADFVADGPPTQLEFFRIVHGVAVALAAIHAQGTTSHERRLAERAGPHLGGSHRDVKPGNILLRRGKDGGLELPILSTHAAAQADSTEPSVALADMGLAAGPAEDAEPHRHDQRIVTESFLSPDLALSDLARCGADLRDHLPRGALVPPVMGALEVGVRVDMHALGVSCFNMQRPRPRCASGVPQLDRIARGMGHATGHTTDLPTRATRPQYATAMLLTGGMHVTAKLVLDIQSEMLGDAIVCSGTPHRTKAEERHLGPAAPVEVDDSLPAPSGHMATAYLTALARSSQTQGRRGTARDRAVAEAALLLDGEVLVHATVGVVEPGAFLPLPYVETATALRLPHWWVPIVRQHHGLGPATLCLRRRERPRAKRERLRAFWVGVAAGRCVAAAVIGPMLRLIAALVDGCDEWDEWGSAFDGGVCTAADDAGLCSVGDWADVAGWQFAAQSGGDEPAVAPGYAAAWPVLGAHDEEAMWPRELQGACPQPPSAICQEQRPAVRRSTDGSEGMGWHPLGIGRADGAGLLSSRSLPRAAAAAGPGLLTAATAAFASGSSSTAASGVSRATSASTEPDTEPVLPLTAAPAFDGSDDGTAHNSSLRDTGSQPGDGTRGACVSPPQSEGAAVACAGTASEASQGRVTFGGFIGDKACSEQSLPEGELSAGERGITWYNGAGCDSGRLIGSCPGEAPPANAASYGSTHVSGDADPCAVSSVGCPSEVKVSIAGEDRKTGDALVPAVLPRRSGLLQRLKRALCIGATLGVPDAGAFPAASETPPVGKGARAGAGRTHGVACLLGRLVGCRGLRVKE